MGIAYYFAAGLALDFSAKVYRLPLSHFAGIARSKMEKFSQPPHLVAPLEGDQFGADGPGDAPQH